MDTALGRGYVTLDTSLPIWDRFFIPTPLIIVGSRDEEGNDNLAPKNMAMPLGAGNYFGFMCTPRHRTHRNIEHTRAFSVSFPPADHVVMASIAATPRSDDGIKHSLAALPTDRATRPGCLFLREAYVWLECELARVVEGFDDYNLIAGKILAAHVSKEALRSSDRDDNELVHDFPLVTYLHPGRYAEVDRSYAFPFPLGFHR